MKPSALESLFAKNCVRTTEPTGYTDALNVRTSSGLQERINPATIAKTRMAGPFNIRFNHYNIAIMQNACTCRYDSAGNPVQEVFYFPLLDRLATMYKDKEWRHALTYPDTRRRRAAGTRSDYFDGKIYKRLRSAAGPCEHFIAFAHCADAVAANKRMSRSILPINLRCVTASISSVIFYYPF